MSNNDPIANVGAMLIFSHVVEEQSFTQAARRLGISKASVSREISRLEARLGAQLLRRTTRTMSLTEVGQVFYDHCQRVVEEAAAAELSISRLRAAPSGLIRLAAPMSFGRLEFAPRLARFLEEHPEIQVEVELTDRIIDLIHERIDLSLRIGRPRNQSHVLRRLCPIRAMVVAAPSYLDHARDVQTTRDLLNHNCLCYRGPTETWFFRGGERIEVQGNARADNGDALRRLALDGVGIAYLPTFIVAEDVRSGRLAPLLPEAWHPGNLLYAVYPESRHLSPKVRAMIDWLVRDYGEEPTWDQGLSVAGAPAHQPRAR